MSPPQPAAPAALPHVLGLLLPGCAVAGSLRRGAFWAQLLALRAGARGGWRAARPVERLCVSRSSQPVAGGGRGRLPSRSALPALPRPLCSARSPRCPCPVAFLGPPTEGTSVQRALTPQPQPRSPQRSPRPPPHPQPGHSSSARFLCLCGRAFTGPFARVRPAVLWLRVDVAPFPGFFWKACRQAAPLPGRG